MNGYCRK